MAQIEQTSRVATVLRCANDYCKGYRHEFLMPEHMLRALIEDLNFNHALNIFYDPLRLIHSLEEFFDTVESVPGDDNYEAGTSCQTVELLTRAMLEVKHSNAKRLDITHLTRALISLEDSWAAYLLRVCLHNREMNFLSQLVSFCEFDDMFPEGEDYNDDADGETRSAPEWKKWVTCMNEHYKSHNTLIGREHELNRTIEVLCRLDKNNPLHVGEPGVGKTALVWGLVQRIEEGKVPKRLKGSRIYQLDMGTLVAGTQYRGDFENRIKLIMDGIVEEGDNHIVYIDEIHTLVGAGASGNGALDASNMLKPYLEAGQIRFIGATTYDEFNRHFSRSRGLTRRFQQIDIAEPTVDEAIHILMQLKPRYEKFHGVKYDDDAIEFATRAAAKHINDRFLPDKAIDLIDEAGAAMELKRRPTTIGKKQIADVLAKTCKVDALAQAQDDDLRRLETLPQRMLASIYGQDEAIRQVVEAVQMARAGLLDDNKPLASLLFVGPTGVGKTEVARVLSRELGIGLTRFDMSEYTERHAVAKLIGSPAGYVGYEDGGLLTDAIRKSPNCVLLLDEIEKAHEDIYNILLQVMDYARLTDNKGRQADFRNVILIMTSNAGAQHATLGTVGFNSSVTRGQVMLKQVKKTFKPEFINRLSGTVVFNDMDKPMATLILKKKLRELDDKLKARHVKMTLSRDATEFLLNEGFTAEYGAREMDRAIARHLKPLLMREILFGRLKDGGKAKITLKDACLSIR